MTNEEKLLRDGLNALNLPTDDEKVAKLLAFIALIEKWNKAYNLTAIRRRDEMVNLHLLDSVAILPYLEGKRMIDVGTGAGLPSIPLSIFCPDIEFQLLDSNAKKTRFVQQAILELKLPNVKVTHSRVEDFEPEQPFDTVLTRAFASLPEIVELTQHLISENGTLLCMKGQTPDEELAAVNAQTTLISINVPHIEAERCLVKITHLKN
ncbi:MAG: 16S rRNA (guanine(527)-N(7))-methyltransferase RsmG [Methylococcales bacterium]|nr:16S rRNA (guanine(527)-N(7))-methyltransferase RsmG [Methylococcales bacterium]